MSKDTVYIKTYTTLSPDIVDLKDASIGALAGYKILEVKLKPWEALYKFVRYWYCYTGENSNSFSNWYMFVWKIKDKDKIKEYTHKKKELLTNNFLKKAKPFVVEKNYYINRKKELEKELSDVNKVLANNKFTK